MPEYKGALCNRVNKSGKTCREEYEDDAVSQNNISDDLNEKSNVLYDTLFSQIGTKIPESEFAEWSEYLTRLKNNIKTQNASKEDLESFLSYTEKMYSDLKN